MIDQLRQIAILAKTIDHGAFRGAARELRLSPSVVSHHISQLEEHLGVALIYRTTRKLTLTNEGIRLLNKTRPLLEAVEGELTDLATSASAPSGELRMTISSVLSQSTFTDRIADFVKAYPRIQLFIDFSDTRRGIIDSQLDFAIRMRIDGENSATTRKLFQMERHLVAAPSFLDSKAAYNEPNDLMDWDWLMLKQTEGQAVHFKPTQGAEQIIKPSARLLTNDVQALYRMALKGCGLAIVPEFLAEKGVQKGLLRYVLPDWTLPSLTVYAEWPANAPKHGLIHLALNAFSQHT